MDQLQIVVRHQNIRKEQSASFTRFAMLEAEVDGSYGQPLRPRRNAGRMPSVLFIFIPGIMMVDLPFLRG